MKLNDTSQGKALSNRYTVKEFKYADDMNRFLSKGDNAMTWKESKHDLKSGVYMSQLGYDREAGKAIVTFTKVG